MLNMYTQAFRGGKTFRQFLETAAAHHDLWTAITRRAQVAPETVERVTNLPGSWRLLVLADDWCGDAVNTLPVVARLAEAAGVDLRIVPRDAYSALRDRHLTNGSRSIPVVIVLDAGGRPRGWWGPRPRALQDWFQREGRSLPQTDRYRELRRWYAHDRGVTTAREIAALLSCAAAELEPPHSGTRPCGRRAAA